MFGLDDHSHLLPILGEGEKSCQGSTGVGAWELANLFFTTKAGNAYNRTPVSGFDMPVFDAGKVPCAVMVRPYVNGSSRFILAFLLGIPDLHSPWNIFFAPGVVGTIAYEVRLR
jgi:hypothetical protein